MRYARPSSPSKCINIFVSRRHRAVHQDGVDEKLVGRGRDSVQIRHRERSLPDHGASQGERDAVVGRVVLESLSGRERLLPERGVQRGKAGLVLPARDQRT